jgi:hypothetical protein
MKSITMSGMFNFVALSCLAAHGINHHARSKRRGDACAGLPTRGELAGQLKAAARQMQIDSSSAVAFNGTMLPVTML